LAGVLGEYNPSLHFVTFSGICPTGNPALAAGRAGTSCGCVKPPTLPRTGHPPVGGGAQPLADLRLFMAQLFNACRVGSQAGNALPRFYLRVPITVRVITEIPAGAAREVRTKIRVTCGLGERIKFRVIAERSGTGAQSFTVVVCG
jgi:hypothetical protein